MIIFPTRHLVLSKLIVHYFFIDMKFLKILIIQLVLLHEFLSNMEKFAERTILQS